MGIFKKKNNGLSNVTEHSIQLYDQEYAPYVGATPKDYEMPEIFESRNMLPLIDKQLEKLLAGGALDGGNGDVLDNFINDIMGQAATNLNIQHEDHENTIRQLILRLENVRVIKARELERTQEVLSEVKDAYRDLDNRYKKIKFRKDEK